MLFRSARVAAAMMILLPHLILFIKAELAIVPFDVLLPSPLAPFNSPNSRPLVGQFLATENIEDRIEMFPMQLVEKVRGLAVDIGPSQMVANEEEELGWKGGMESGGQVAMAGGARDWDANRITRLPGEQEVENSCVLRELGKGSSSANEVVRVHDDAVED